VISGDWQQRVLAAFETDTGLAAEFDCFSTVTSFSVPELHCLHFLDGHTSDVEDGWNVEGEWVVPVNPYIYWHFQAALAAAGFAAVRSFNRLPSQVVPAKFQKPWRALSRLRRLIYGNPKLWLLW
jgi:hypothetical protein